MKTRPEVEVFTDIDHCESHVDKVCCDFIITRDRKSFCSIYREYLEGCDLRKCDQCKADYMEAENRHEISQPVLNLAHLMQYKLDKNKHKDCSRMNGDGKGRKWDNMSRKWLLGRLKDEVVELEIELNKGPGHGANIGLECADVANFAMMILDNTGRKV